MSLVLLRRLNDASYNPPARCQFRVSGLPVWVSQIPHLTVRCRIAAVVVIVVNIVVSSRRQS